MAALTQRNFFIIAGLPRSGTAFLATMLNLHPDIIAFHEGYVSSTPYLKRMEKAADECKVVVDVTTCILPAFDGVPASRIFLHRNEDECFDSAKKIVGVGPRKWDIASDMAARWKAKHQPLTISFDILVEKMGIRIAYKMLMAAMGIANKIPLYKLDQIQAMNIQLHGMSESYYDDKTIQEKP